MNRSQNPSKKLPYDFIQRHYREPATDDPIRRWLPHPQVARAICGALLAGGIPDGEIEDALQDVYVKSLRAFRKKDAQVPADLHAMKAFCATVAKNYAIDTRKAADKRERDFVGLCDDPDEYSPLEYGAEQRDPVDAGRQLAVLAQLFREGRMPEDGVDILEGIASGCTHEEIALELEITTDTVEGRVRRMRERFRRRLAKLGMLPGMWPLELVVSTPAAIETLRRAA